MKLLYFTASWCQPCKTYGPIMDNVAQSGIPVQKIDVDKSLGEAQKYGIQNVPTVIKVDSQNNVINTLIGVNSEQKVREFYNG